MDPTENYPSLIDCLETSRSGLALDLIFPSGSGASGLETPFRVSPFSKTIRGRIQTDGNDIIQHVHLVLQREQPHTPASLVPVNNIVVEAAWQKAFAFHQHSGRPKAPLFFKHQIDTNGQLQPFQPLFHCRETKRWFHPPCPQCGLVLTLCRDDALLKTKGLSAYSDSLERFLYCRSCAALSDASPFYTLEKKAGMPELVHGVDALATQWKHLLANLPGEADLPCRGCPNTKACYGPELLASRRIVPFSFFPFYMMMFPAPSVTAADFLRMISGSADASVGASGFLFQDQDRQFLEILYLKLTFLAQIFRQCMPVDRSEGTPEMDLSLEGIGVDLYPSGAGLPDYWNFDARILDAIGSSRMSPFAPVLPQAPRLHFLGALWFRTLLVNSNQDADVVFAHVGRLVDSLTDGQGMASLRIDTPAEAGVFGGGQVFWVPDQRRLPENWQAYWTASVHLGFQMVHAGLKTGVSWDNDQFLEALDGLRKQIRNEMFAGPVAASADPMKPAPSEKINRVLRRILEKWQTEAKAAGSPPVSDVTPDEPESDETVVFSASPPVPPLSHDAGLPTPEADDWDPDLQETVVFSAPDARMSSEGLHHDGVPEPPPQERQWDDDIEETVVLRPGSSAVPPPADASHAGDMDQTVVISPSPTRPDESPPMGNDDRPAATMTPSAPGLPPSRSFVGADGDLEETVILNTGGGTPAPPKEDPATDADLAATMIQRAGGDPPPSAPPPGVSNPPDFRTIESEDDLDATIIINPTSRPVASNPPQAMSTEPAVDDLAATLIETPRSTSTNPPGKQGQGPPAPPVMPPFPQAAPEFPAREVQAPVAAECENDDDEIMEQTIIIRSDVKKE